MVLKDKDFKKKIERWGKEITVKRMLFLPILSLIPLM
jgi:hypothetical protein